MPTFYLYGEPHRAGPADFLHVERLDDRSRPSEWTIRPHAHADLDQLFLIEAGGGVMSADADRLGFAAPTLLIVPAGVIHGFEWSSESAGWVLTLAHSKVQALAGRHPELALVFSAAACASFIAGRGDMQWAPFDTLARELGWAAPGHDVAVEAALLQLLVAALRLIAPLAGSDQRVKHGADLVARFRAMVEQRFRLREPIADYATALGVSETRLRTACRRIAGRSPVSIIDDRGLLEARRALRYTNLSVSELGYSIGFADPAYFSRFFSRHVGVSPSGYRRAV